MDTVLNSLMLEFLSRGSEIHVTARDEFRPRQTRQLPRAVDVKGWFLSCQSY